MNVRIQELEDALMRGEKLTVNLYFEDNDGTPVVDVVVDKDGEHFFSDLCFETVEEALEEIEKALYKGRTV